VRVEVAVLVAVSVVVDDRVGETIVVFRLIGMVVPVPTVPVMVCAVMEELTDAMIDVRADESCDETTELTDEMTEETDSDDADDCAEEIAEDADEMAEAAEEMTDEAEGAAVPLPPATAI
jgi:hypothetical protein